MDNFISVIKSIDKDHECDIVLGGDFNFIFNTDLESDGGNPKLKLSSVATFNSLSNEFSLVDICDQTAYVPGRYIRDSVRLISDILEFTEIHNIPGYMITADIEKAFDSIEHNFITATLQESCVMNN